MAITAVCGWHLPIGAVSAIAQPDIRNTGIRNTDIHNDNTRDINIPNSDAAPLPDLPEPSACQMAQQSFYPVNNASDSHLLTFNLGDFAPIAQAPGVALYEIFRPLDPEPRLLIYAVNLAAGGRVRLANTLDPVALNIPPQFPDQATNHAPNPVPDRVFDHALATESLPESLPEFSQTPIAPASPERATPAYETHRSPQLVAQSIGEHWSSLVAQVGDRAFAVLNGQFFGANPLQLAFPVKVDGEILSGGYAGRGEYDGEKWMLTIDGNHAAIARFPETGYPDNPLFSDVPNLIVGLDPCADKGVDEAVGRTFAGVDDRDGDGQAETVIFALSAAATQTEMLQILHQVGVDAVLMLDGGGSTQTIVLGEERIRSSDQDKRGQARGIPHAIGIQAAASPLAQNADRKTE